MHEHPLDRLIKEAMILGPSRGISVLIYVKHNPFFNIQTSVRTLWSFKSEEATRVSQSKLQTCRTPDIPDAERQCVR